MHSIESRFVTGPSNRLSAGVYVCTVQPENFTGCGSDGVKRKIVLVCACIRVLATTVVFFFLCNLCFDHVECIL